MHRILIVDDEFLGLKTTIDWSANGYVIVGEASNGKEALDMVRRLQPEIVLTDIKMPVMDGIELITEMRKIDKGIKVIILSNHDNFQYAKQAMKLGVSQYILKSEINKETLLSTLESIRQNMVIEKHDDQIHDDKGEEYLKKNLRKGAINSCVPIERIAIAEEEVFCNPPYIMLKYFCDISMMKEEAIEMLLKTIETLMKEEFPNAILHLGIYRVHCYVTAICSVGELGQEMERYFVEKSGHISRRLQYYFAIQLKGGCSQIGDVSHIPRMFQEVEEARQRCFFGDAQFCIYDGKEQERMMRTKRPHVSNTVISQLIHDKNQEGIQEYISKIFSSLKVIKCYAYVEHSFISLLSIAREHVEKLKGMSNCNLINKLEYDSLYSLTSIDDVEKYISDIYETLLITDNLEKDNYSISVKKCIAYIKEHYA
ncbi:MAG: response regulator, partial [Lachnospiraceae bacterium]